MKNNLDRQYLELLKYILDNGVVKKDRTGTGTISIFGSQMRFDMREGFPIITSKKMFMKGIIHELIWFLRGDTNIKYLVDNGVGIWNGDAYKSFLSKSGMDLTKDEFIERIKNDDTFSKKWGNLGPVYGKQWRNWEHFIEERIPGPGLVSPAIRYKKSSIDQIKNLISELRSNPDSRRLMVNAWNPGEINNMVLPPCHYVFQCWTREMDLDERIIWGVQNEKIQIGEWTHSKLDAMRIPRRYLSLSWSMRSIDFLLGFCFNVSSYGLLLHLLAKEVNMVPLDLVFSGGDCHLYLNHIDQAKEQLNRETYDLCTIKLNNESIDDLKYEDIQILNYKSSGVLKAELSN